MPDPSPRQIIDAAITHHQAGRLDEAKALYEQVLAADPNHDDALHLLGVIAHQQSRHEEAIALIRRAIAIDPNAAMYHSNLGEALRATGRHAEAADAYRTALGLQPDLAQAHNNFGLALLAMGRLENAIAAHRAAVAAAPNYAEAWRNLGLALEAAHRPSEAVDCYRKAITARSDFAEAFSSLGACLASLGVPEDAIAACRRAIELKPDLADAHNHLAVALLEAGRADEAAEACKAAIRLRPDMAEAHENLGVALANLGRYDESRAAHTEAARLKPRLAALQFHRAAVGAEQSNQPAPAAPPPRLVADLFDRFAPTFDRHLSENLHYRVPELLFRAVTATTSPPNRFGTVLDLGCGTGLCGVRFRPLARTLIGVDLAPKMIDEAAKRGIYDDLRVGEAAEALDAFNHELDLILAGDVLCYVGDLADIFRRAALALRGGGLFAFSVEAATAAEAGKDFILRPKTLRYAHSREYFSRLIQDADLAEISAQSEILRLDAGADVPGWIVVAQVTP